MQRREQFSIMRWRKGFTLFELSVVVLIGIIIVTFLILSAQSLLIRTKVSRVKEEHRMLTRALQNYLMDYSALPNSTQGLRTLERPTAYMGTLPRDPFQGGRVGTYLYLQPNSSEIASVIISPGPDGQFHLPAELWKFASVHEINPDLVPIRAQTRSMAAGDDANEDTSIVLPMMSESELATLRAYLQLGVYDMETGKGDIISVITY